LTLLQKKIEHAILELHNFASLCEYHTPFQESPRATTLQENLERITLELELAKRPIVDKNQVVMQSQNRNIVIISRNAINLAVLLNKLPQNKLLEYDMYGSFIRYLRKILI